MKRKREPRRKAAGALPVFALTDAQWSEIVRLLALPPPVASNSAAGNARQDLQIFLGIHWQHKQRWTNNNRTKFAAIRGHLRELQELFRHFNEQEAVKTVERLEKRYFVAGGEQTRTRGRSKDNAAYMLVDYLAGFMERFAGKKLSRSSNRDNTSREFIKYICEIVVPNIGTGTIENAIKDCITRSREAKKSQPRQPPARMNVA